MPARAMRVMRQLCGELGEDTTSDAGFSALDAEMRQEEREDGQGKEGRGAGTP